MHSISHDEEGGMFDIKFFRLLRGATTFFNVTRAPGPPNGGGGYLFPKLFIVGARRPKVSKMRIVCV